MSGTSVMDTFFSDGAQGQARRGPNGSGFQVPFAESAFGFGHFDAGAMFAQHQHMMRSLSEGSFGPMGFLPGPGRAYGAQAMQQPGSYATVEELPDTPLGGRRRSQSQPIVEEPEERSCPERTYSRQSRSGRHRRQPQPQERQPQQQQQQQRQRQVTDPNMHFSSSSYCVSMGPDGVTQASSSQTRMGPGGVAEHQRRRYDGQSGQHSAVHSRAVNGRGRSIQSSRTGQEDWTSNQTLHNMDAGDVDCFDQEFSELANNAFPASRRSGARVPERLRLT